MPDKLSITFEGTSRELFMSYGLLNELTGIVSSPEIVPQISLYKELREEVLGACLAERKPSGKVTKKIDDMDDIDMSIEDVEAVIDWASEAILSFFVRSLGKMAKQAEANKDVFAGLKSSLAGLQD